MMLQIHIQQCPDYMRDLVTSTATGAMRSGLHSASRLSCRKLVVRTKFGERAFNYEYAAWNSLPPCLQSTTNTNSFKRQLKTHFFTEAFKSFYRFNCSY